MTRDVADPIESTLRLIVRLLVERRYAELERLTNGVRLRATEIESAVLEYGKTITDPPLEAFSLVDLVPVQGVDPPAYSVRFRLYTLEEGLSDLELQATFIDDPQSAMRAELDNLIVA